MWLARSTLTYRWTRGTDMRKPANNSHPNDQLFARTIEQNIILQTFSVKIFLKFLMMDERIKLNSYWWRAFNT